MRRYENARIWAPPQNFSSDEIAARGRRMVVTARMMSEFMIEKWNSPALIELSLNINNQCCRKYVALHGIALYIRRFSTTTRHLIENQRRRFFEAAAASKTTSGILILLPAILSEARWNRRRSRGGISPSGCMAFCSSHQLSNQIKSIYYSSFITYYCRGCWYILMHEKCVGLSTVCSDRYFERGVVYVFGGNHFGNKW